MEGNPLRHSLRLSSSVNFLFSLVVLLVVCFGFLNLASAAPTKLLNYQARITDPSGESVSDGSYSIVFRIYNVASGGSALWTETNEVSLEDGILDVRLGNSTPINLDFNTGTYYLGVTIEDDSELSPRRPIGAAPFALNSSLLDGRPIGTGPNDVLALDNSSNLNLPNNLNTDGNVNVDGNTTIGGNATIDGSLTSGLVNTSFVTLGTSSIGGTNGRIRFTGTDFEGFFGGVWHSLTSGGSGTTIEGTPTSGQTVVVNSSGDPTFTTISGDVTLSNTGVTTINSNSVSLGTDTTGSYVAGVLAGNGITVTGSGGEASTPTVALGPLTSNWNQTAPFDIVLNNASSELRMLESIGGTFFGTIDIGDLTADATYTLSGPSGTILTTSNYTTTLDGDYATRQLDNLSGTAINTNLLPDTNITHDLGSDTLRWQDIYLGPGTLHIGASGDEATLSYDPTTNDLRVNTQLSLSEITAPAATANFGKIYVKSDSKLYYMDESGTEFDLTATGSGSVSGSGLTGQIAFWTASNAIGGSNNFTWDNTNQIFNITGDTTVDGDLTVTGDTNIGGNTIIDGDLTVLGITNLEDVFITNLDVTNPITNLEVTNLDVDNLTVDNLTFTGVLDVANGGTGNSSFTTNGVLYGDGTNPIAQTLAPTPGQILMGNASGTPTFTTISGDITIDSSGVATVSSGIFATTQLDNLSSTAINTDLIPDTNITHDLGSDTLRWADIYLGPGSMHIGTSTSDEGSIFFNTTNDELNIALDGTTRLLISDTGNLVQGTGALSTSATSGFPYVASMAGTPTGTPTSYSGRVPFTYNTATNGLYFYNGGWQLIAGGGVGAVSGSGSSGQVTFWNGPSSVTGSSTFLWNNGTGSLSLGTTPATTGVIALPNNQSISWRNVANNGNMALRLDTGNRYTYSVEGGSFDGFGFGTQINASEGGSDNVYRFQNSGSGVAYIDIEGGLRVYNANGFEFNGQVAPTGIIRLPNNQGVSWRTTGGGAQGLRVDSNDDYQFDNTTGSFDGLGFGGYFTLSPGGSDNAYRFGNSGSGKAFVDVEGSLRVYDGNEFDFSSTVASSGLVRMPNNKGLAWRTTGGGVQGLRVDSSDNYQFDNTTGSFDGLGFGANFTLSPGGSDNAYRFSNSGSGKAFVDVEGSLRVYDANGYEFNDLVASSGLVRMPNNKGLAWRTTGGGVLGFRLDSGNRYNYSVIAGSYNGGIGWATTFNASEGGDNNTYRFMNSGSGLASIDVEGSLRVFNANDFGSGIVVAETGTIRLPNGATIRARNAANTADIDLISSSGDTIVFNNPVNFNTTISSSMIPTLDDTYDIGTSSLRWRDLYLGPTSLHIVSNASETTTARDYRLAIQETDGATEGNLRVMLSSTDLINITPGGNTGIGITNPYSKLVVRAGENATLSTFQADAAAAGLLIQSPSSNNTHKGGIFWATDFSITDGDPAAGIWMFQDGSGFTSLVFGTSNSNDGITNTAMIIDEDSNVGIGLNTPLSGLALNYKTFIRGNTTTPWTIGMDTPGVGNSEGFIAMNPGQSGLYSIYVEADDNDNFLWAGTNESEAITSTINGNGTLWTQGNLSVGTSSPFTPSYSLSVLDDGTAAGFGNDLGTYYVTINPNQTAGASVSVVAAGNDALSLWTGFNSASSATSNINGAGDATFAGTVTAADVVDLSDARLKTDIKSVSDGLEIIRQLQPVSYNLQNSSSGRHAGFIAQEVQKVLADSVVKGSDGYFGLRYTDFIPYVVKAVQELDVKVISLKQEVDTVKITIADLKNEVTTLKGKVAGIEDRVSALEENSGNSNNSIEYPSKTSLPVAEGANEMKVEWPEPVIQGDYRVFVTPNWNAGLWITDKLPTSFVVKFANPAPANAKIDYKIEK